MSRSLASFVAAAWMLLSSAAGRAQEPVAPDVPEEVLSFDADIRISRDGDIEVFETIRVRAAGVAIKYGINRDFPNLYGNVRGRQVNVDLEVESVTRDGAPEVWGYRFGSIGIVVGNHMDEKALLEPGEHVYTLRYRILQPLAFFEQRDELSWNVTGNGWSFPIREARAKVRLPGKVPADRLDASGFTGTKGSRASDVTVERFDGGASFASTRALAAREGLRVTLAFPKGVVREPAAVWGLLAQVRATLYGPIAVGGLLALWAFYLRRWHVMGRDPDGGVRIPFYEPPRGYSAAAARFVWRMGYDDKCFAAALMALASKGALKMDEDDGGTHTLVRLPDADNVDFGTGERELLDALFADSRTSVELIWSKDTEARMKAAKAVHAAALRMDHERKYFATNRRTVLIGVAISVFTQVFALGWQPSDDASASVIFSALLTSTCLAAYLYFSSGWTVVAGRASMLWAFTGALLLCAFIVGFACGLASGAGGVMLLLVLGLLVTNIAFYHLMKAPTRDGAKLRNEIEGFRWYLGVAEKAQVDARYRPEVRSELFARYLPYALALDIDRRWAERFSEALPTEEFVRAQPHWYRAGRARSGGSGSVDADAGSSLTASISSASTAPGRG